MIVEFYKEIIHDYYCNYQIIHIKSNKLFQIRNIIIDNTISYMPNCMSFGIAEYYWNNY